MKSSARSRGVSLSFVFSILVSLLLSQSATAQANLIDYVVAQVGNQIVLKSDLETAILQMEGQGYSINAETKCEVFENLISAKILAHQAKLDSIEVTQPEIMAEVEYRIQAYKQRLGSKENMESYFKKDEEAIRKTLARTLKENKTTQKMQRELTKDITVSMDEIRQLFSLMDDETLPRVPKKYKFAQITREVKPSKPDEQAVKDRLNGYRERIISGEASFDALASLYSVGPSASAKGVLGYTNRSSLDPEYAAAAYKLKTDEVSRVVKSAFGYHIIKLLGRKGDRVNTQHIILRPEISTSQIQKQETLLDSIQKDLKLKKYSFEEAARFISMDEDSRANGGLSINKVDGSNLFKEKELEPTVLEQLKTMQEGEISEVVLTQDERTKVQVLKLLKLVEVVPAHKLNIKDDYQAVKNQALERKKEKMIKNWVEKKFKSTYIRIDKNHRECPFLQERNLL